MVTKKIRLTNFEEAMRLFGSRDENLKNIEKRLGVQIFSRQSYARGDFILSVRGPSGKVEEAVRLIESARAQGRFERLSTSSSTKEDMSRHDTDIIITTHNNKHIRPRSHHQKEYVDAIEKYDVVISIGPAGTGKTFLAVACAISALQSGRVSKIILTRPVVEAGEKLGFLPGDFQDKVEPYLRPLYDAFYTIVGPDRFRLFKEDEVVEIIPLAYMRGRTMEDAFIILDEAQNTTSAQMKMFLTRLGIGAKAVITGDITQVDLEKKNLSGLVIAQKILSHIEDIKIVNFTEADVVRHAVVRKILQAYESHNL